MELLGSAILDQAVSKAFANKLHTCHLMTHRLHQLYSHTGFFWRNEHSLPRLLILLRPSPCYRHSDDQAPYEECTRNAAESICNVQFDDTGWKQAELPVHFGVLGLRSAYDLALPAYLSSHESCRRFASTIHQSPSEPSVENADDVNTTRTSSGIKIPDDLVRQSSWDSLLLSA